MDTWKEASSRVNQVYDYPGWTTDQYSYHVSRHGDPRVGRVQSAPQVRTSTTHVDVLFVFIFIV